MTAAVRNTPEFRRILDLPRRTWTEPQLLSLTAELSSQLKTPWGTMSLRPIQALALHDIGVYGGLFGPMRVGSGKTLVTLLAAHVLNAQRPLLLLPAALIEKTYREMHELAKHWQIPKNIYILSYEKLSRADYKDELERYRPDLVVADECHRLKSRKAACTRRVSRYVKEHKPAFVGVSGTVIKHSLYDFAHLITWATPGQTPVPQDWNILEEWACALDEKVKTYRLQPGALLTLPGAEGETELEAARRGFHKRMTETPGIVASAGKQFEASIYIRGHVYPVSAATEANFKRLRSTWEIPCGKPLMMAAEVWRHARELALGFHYRWDPVPPEPWLAARKAWSQFVRQTLTHARNLDSPLEVETACFRGDLPRKEFDAWQKIKNTFVPNKVTVWHDDSALKFCEAWAKKNAGIIWVEHVWFARELAKRTNLPYFGDQGMCEGLYIEDAKGPVIASVKANSTGRNLQQWSRNLITSPLSSADDWEQLVGRTHREGQKSDEVTIDVMFGCWEHANSWRQSHESAAMARDMIGQDQKILIADKLIPAFPIKSSPRWSEP